MSGRVVDDFPSEFSNIRIFFCLLRFLSRSDRPANYSITIVSLFLLNDIFLNPTFICFSVYPLVQKTSSFTEKETLIFLKL